MKADIPALEKILSSNLAVVSRLMEVEKWTQDCKAELQERYSYEKINGQLELANLLKEILGDS